MGRVPLRRPPYRWLVRSLVGCASALLSAWVFAGTAAAAGTGVSISFVSLPSAITADGSSQTTATVQVLDAGNAGVAGDTVTFSSADDPGIGFSNPATDNGDGTYTITITSSTTAGTPTIKATDNTGGNNLTATTTLTQNPGPAKNISLQLTPSQVVANGTDHSTARATVTDAHGNRVPGESVGFSSDGGNTISPTTDHNDGTYTATVTSTTTVGTPKITATDGTLSDQQTLTQTVGPASSISLHLSPAEIVADGITTSTATATVTDAQGHRVPNESVSFSSDSGNAISPTTDHNDGTYTATVTSTTTVGTPTIKAIDGALSDQKTLTQTVGPATQISLQLSPTSIVANGTDHSTATATVRDAQGHQVPGQTVGFASTDAHAVIGATTDHGNGTYTATISSTVAGTPTITATDGAFSDHQTLTQTPGPAANVSVQMVPARIPADGTSQSTATATVTDINHNLVKNDTVDFSSDHGTFASATTNRHDGTYSAVIHGSTTPGQVTVTSTDENTSISGQGILVQDAGPSNTSLVSSAASSVTNQGVTLFATVSPTGLGTVSGTVTFQGASCPAAVVTNASRTAVCQTTFAAAGSPHQLTAAFTPDVNSTVGPSTSAPLVLPVATDPTSTALSLSTPDITAPNSATYTATVSPNHSGAVRPSGTVAFFDGASAISSCSHQPLNGSLTATCTVGYGAAGAHPVSARYSGDLNFAGSQSSSSTETVSSPPPPPVLGTIRSTMQWTFLFTRSYTKVVALVVNGVPSGATVVIQCHGRGCPFAHQTTHLTRSRRCGRRCSARHPGTIDLGTRFGQRHLRVGTRIIVEIVRQEWIGKYYRFTIRSQRGPRVQISCLAPGSQRPGVGC